MKIALTILLLSATKSTYKTSWQLNHGDRAFCCQRSEIGLCCKRDTIRPSGTLNSGQGWCSIMGTLEQSLQVVYKELQFSYFNLCIIPYLKITKSHLVTINIDGPTTVTNAIYWTFPYQKLIYWHSHYFNAGLLALTDLVHSTYKTVCLWTMKILWA